MKGSIFATVAGLAALSQAAPQVRKDGQIGHHVARYGYQPSDISSLLSSSMGGSWPTGGAYPTGGASSTGGSWPTGGYSSSGGSWPTGGSSPTGGSWPSSTASYGYGGSSSPTGTGVASSYSPAPTGNALCPIDGIVVCNGPNYFGLCNFGSVIWQAVAEGMACQNGEVVGTGIYAVPTPWPPAPAGTR